MDFSTIEWASYWGWHFISDYYWAYSYGINQMVLFGSIALFWSFDGWLAHFHHSDRNLRHGINNILLALVNVLVVLTLALGATNLILMVESRQWGVMTFLDFPIWLKIILGILWVDFIIYFTHFLKHRWNWLWRLHLVHHNDSQVDATTVLRQHPGEAIVSFIALTSTTALLGIPAFAITVFYVIANPITVLQHVNIRIPEKLDRWLSYVFNTPNMHKVHHLEEIALSNSNYGYVFSLWDRCFGTFIPPSKDLEWKFGMIDIPLTKARTLLTC